MKASPQLHHLRWTSHLKFKHSILWRQFFSRGNAESSITWSSLLWWQGKENVNPRGKVAPLRPMYSRKSEMQHTMWSKSWNMQMKYAAMSSFTRCTGKCLSSVWWWLLFVCTTAAFYLFSCALHGLLWDVVDLVVHVHIVSLSTLHLNQQHPKAGAPKVQNQEVPMFWWGWTDTH